MQGKINLVKGERRSMAGLTRLRVTMGWKVNPNARPPYDLDASTFLLGEDGQIAFQPDFVFYGSIKQISVQTPDGPKQRPVSEDGSVLGSIDDLGEDEDNTGIGEEEIEVDLSKTAERVKEILFTASIYWEPDSASRNYNFGQVRDAYIRITNDITGEVICRYDLDEDFSTMKGVVFGRLYRRGGEWKFQAVGEGEPQGLEPIVRKYAKNFI